MICEKCGREFPHRKGRFCGTCLPRYADVRVQIKKDCPMCDGEGEARNIEWRVYWQDHDEIGPDAPTSPEYHECSECSGLGIVSEWIWLADFVKLLERTDR